MIKVNHTVRLIEVPIKLPNTGAILRFGGESKCASENLNEKFLNLKKKKLRNNNN
jgi:hypothetical protein